MKRTTISLPDDLGSALEREARRRNSSQSEVARAALRQHLSIGTGEKREIPFAAVGRSSDHRGAAAMEEILAEEWADHIEEDSFGGSRS